jgi:Asp-tRNA(Asn)/Glu-tRNA(Gln) amidotransferase A subunit family amidase
VDALAAAAATVPKTGSVPASLGGMPFESALLAASVPQGRKLRDNAARLQLAVNEKFDTLVSAPDKGKKVSLGNNLELVVLGPNQERLDALEKDWRAKVKAAKKAKKTKPANFMRLTADFVDESVYNLSSIVVLASSGGKRMLLTGDARGDDLLKAVKKAGLMKNGVLHVEVLKVPHHGSDRNVSTEFFRQITADRYVISADGRHGNPDVAMLKMLTEAREDDGDPYEIFLTNKVAKVDTLLKKEKTAGKKLTVVYRPTNGTLLVELGEPLPA